MFLESSGSRGLGCTHSLFRDCCKNRALQKALYRNETLEQNTRTAERVFLQQIPELKSGGTH